MKKRINEREGGRLSKYDQVHRRGRLDCIHFKLAETDEIQTIKAEVQL